MDRLTGVGLNLDHVLVRHPGITVATDHNTRPTGLIIHALLYRLPNILIDDRSSKRLAAAAPPGDDKGN